jgi:hypothetical protein
VLALLDQPSAEREALARDCQWWGKTVSALADSQVLYRAAAALAASPPEGT